MLDRITPLILTYNEAPNIERSLEPLRWARDVVVVDSFSQDNTLQIASTFKQVRIFQRHFDTLENQWNFGLTETDIKTEWVLALDADYILNSEFISELQALPLTPANGWRANFIYCVQGKRLRSGIYPPVTVLFKRIKARYSQDGHAHRVVVQGTIAALRTKILHDDRKPLRHWLDSQIGYTKLEALKLLKSDHQNLSWADRIRRLRVIAPLAVLFYCLLVRGGVLDGWAGLYYAFQRLLAELMLSLYLIERDLGLSNIKIHEAEPTHDPLNHTKQHETV